jgi:hypothetical protein
MGPEFIVANISLDFADEVSAGEIERTVPLLEAEIKRRVPEVKRIFIEAQAWHRPRLTKKS